MNDKPNVIAVILAAGLGKRFGGAKQLASIGGEPMVARVSNAVAEAGADAVVLVAGHEAERVHEAAGLPYVVINERFEEGLGASIGCATTALRQSADALLFCLGDQPGIPASHYAALLDAWDGDANGVVATDYGSSGDGTPGAPVLFAKGWFDELAGLTGDRGAKALLAGVGERLLTVTSCEAAHDVDTPEDIDY